MRRTLLAMLMMLLVVAIWGAASPVVKYTLTYVPPFTFLAIRFTLNSILLLPMTIYYLRTSNYKLSDYISILWLAVLGFLLAIGFGFWGLEYAAATTSVLLGTVLPLLTMIFAYMILKERIGKLELVGTTIAFIGAGVVAAGPYIFEGQDVNATAIGTIMLVLAVVFDALYLTYAKKITEVKQHITPMKFICFSFTFTALMFIPLAGIEQAKLYETHKANAEHALQQYNYCTINLNFEKEYTCDQIGCYLSEQNQNELNNYICVFEKTEANLNTNFATFLNKNIDSYLEGYALLGIFYMVIFSGTLAYGLMQIALKDLDAAEAALFSYLKPLFGLPVAFYLLNETISRTVLFGTIIIIFGILIAEINAKR